MDTLTHTHTEQRVPVPLCLVSTPLPVDQGRNPYPGSSVFFPPFCHFCRTLSLSDFFYCPGMTSMSGVCERRLKERYTEGETHPPAAFPPPPSSRLRLPCLKEVALQRRKSKVDCETPGRGREKTKTMPNFVVLLPPAKLQNGLLKQETVRKKESKRLHSFYESCPVSVSAPVQCFL